MARHTVLACVAPTCRPFRGRHTAACLETDAKCDGCLPRLAADGLRLCGWCVRLLGEDAGRLVVRYRELERVLAGAGGVFGERVRVTGRDPNLKLNVAAADARARIRAELSGLVRLVVDERGVSLPTRVRVVEQPRLQGFVGPMPLVAVGRFWDTSVAALGAFVQRHVEWLAAHRAADEHAAVLRTLVRETFGVAFPSGMRLFPIRVPGVRGVAGCPLEVAQRVAFVVDRRGVVVELMEPVSCPGSLWTVLRAADDRLPAEVLCDHATEHRWPAREWLSKLGPALARRAAEAEREQSGVAA
jgi:hypothetical protein